MSGAANIRTQSGSQPAAAATAPSALTEPHLARLRALLGSDAILTSDARLRPYETDAMPLHSARPTAVLLPRDAAAAIAAIRCLHEAEVPWVARGAGTGLSGGALAPDRGVILSVARLRRILTMDALGRRTCVEPGVINLELDRAAAAHGLMFAPDPSSQMACTIGGNVATNAGGPRTLKYGVTSQHLLGARLVLADGSQLELGGAEETMAGYDLLALICGSEGTCGLVTEVTLRLVPRPEASHTFLAVFGLVAEASSAVTALLREGVVPAALEMIDAEVLTALAEAFGLGLPLDVGALLVGEIDGLSEQVDAELERAEQTLLRTGAREVRLARGAEEGEALWMARKKTFGALGRVSPNYLSHDAVIPRTALPAVLQQISEVGGRHRLRIANIFHAGDGNLHPAILFDDADPDQRARAQAAGEEILRICLSAGGVLTGEHGIGISKRSQMRWVYGDVELRLMDQLRRIFDPWDEANPGKVLPVASDGASSPAGFAEGSLEDDARAIDESAEVSAPRPMTRPQEPEDAEESLADPTSQDGEAEIAAALRRAWEQWGAIMPFGAGTLTVAPPLGDPLPLASMQRILRQDPSDMTITVEPGVRLGTLAERLAREGQRLAWEAPLPNRATVGGVVAGGYWGSRALELGHPKHSLLGFRAVIGTGEVITYGARVVKNVSGFDLARLMVGSRGTLGVMTQLILRTYPRPVEDALAVIEGPHEILLAIGAQLGQRPLGWTLLDLLADGERSALAVGLDGSAAEVGRRWREIEAIVGGGDGDRPADRKAATARLLRSEEARAARAEIADWLRWDEVPLILRLVVAPRHAADLAARVHELCLLAANGTPETPPWVCRVQCHLGLGLLRISFAEEFDEAPLRRLLLALADDVRERRGYRALDRAPGDLWWGWDPWGAPRALAERMRRVKLAFDPRGVLAPWMLEGWTWGV